MAATTLSNGRIVGIVIAVIVVFALGFVIGWVSAPTDEDSTVSSEKYEMKYIAKQRKEQMKIKDGFHKKLFEILNAEKIGENLR